MANWRFLWPVFGKNSRFVFKRLQGLNTKYMLCVETVELQRP